MTLILLTATIALIVYLFVKQKQQEANNRAIQTVTSLSRGEDSERNLILFLLRYGISPNAIFHDAYFHYSYDHYAQTDIIVATKVGIIVFEVKDYSGWIFGDGNHKNWTQVLAYGAEKHKFYNPILQNKTHIEVVKNQLHQFQSIPFFSVIVFFGNCTLKSINNIPPNTYVIYASDIKRCLDIIINNNPIAPYTNKWDVVNALKAGVKNGENRDIIFKHRTDIHNRHIY